MCHCWRVTDLVKIMGTKDETMFLITALCMLAIPTASLARDTDVPGPTVESIKVLKGWNRNPTKRADVWFQGGRPVQNGIIRDDWSPSEPRCLVAFSFR